MSEFVRVTTGEPVVEICLARRDKRNAITDAMYAALTEALDAADAASDVRCAIIFGDGETFTGGNDLKDFVAVATSGDEYRTMSAGRFLDALTRFSKPLLAAVQGQAVGIGTTMLLHCDLVFASGDARFSTPFVALGLTPEGSSSVLMPARMGYARAYAMLALGQVMTADEAKGAGLVNEVVGIGDALPAARAAAAALCARPQEALAIAKRLMKGDQQSVRDVMQKEGEIFYERMRSSEAQAAFAQFFQARAAR